MGDLTKHFSRSEFACKDGCGSDIINPDLVAKLEALRLLLGEPLVISSGCRCAARNQKEGGRSDSAHLRGYAADIACKNSRQRWNIVSNAVHLFKRVHLGRKYVHVDVDEGLPQNVMALS